MNDVYVNSATIEMIMRHWVGEAPKPGQNVDMPFDLENFSRENDQLLALIRSTDRPLFFKQTILPLSPIAGTVAYAVFEGSPLEAENRTRKKPIAWFLNMEDMNRFIFNECEKFALMKENENLRLDLAEWESGRRR